MACPPPASTLPIRSEGLSARPGGSSQSSWMRGSGHACILLQCMSLFLPIATLPQEFISAMPPKADKPEPTRMTLPSCGLGCWWGGQKLRTLIGTSPFYAYLGEDPHRVAAGDSRCGLWVHKDAHATTGPAISARSPRNQTGLPSRGQRQGE